MLAMMLDALAACHSFVQSLPDIFPRAASSIYIRRYATSSVFVMQLQRVHVSDVDALNAL